MLELPISVQIADTVALRLHCVQAVEAETVDGCELPHRNAVVRPFDQKRNCGKCAFTYAIDVPIDRDEIVVVEHSALETSRWHPYPCEPFKGVRGIVRKMDRERAILPQRINLILARRDHFSKDVLVGILDLLALRLPALRDSPPLPLFILFSSSICQPLNVP